jgi:hypothetical protein
VFVLVIDVRMCGVTFKVSDPAQPSWTFSSAAWWDTIVAGQTLLAQQRDGEGARMAYQQEPACRISG